MTTFKEIRGTTIEVVSSDPANPETGQIWYNSSSGTLKYVHNMSAAWSSGGNINTAREHQEVEQDSNSRSVAFGGQQPPGRTATELIMEQVGQQLIQQDLEQQVLFQELKQLH
jgi:hypothetical protein